MDELKNLSIDELTAAFDEAKAKFDEIIASDDASRVSEASELADLMDAIDAQKVEIETQEQAAADQLAALKDRKFGNDKAEAEAADEDPAETSDHVEKCVCAVDED